jgi:creatinine amidohydrolase
VSSSLFVTPGIELFEKPHDEARRLVRGGAPVFLTVNPVEYHGPHLSLHNDRLVSRGLARDLHARLAVHHPEWPLLFGADLEVGVEPCPGRGTRHVHYPTVRKLVLEACRALAELGAERVVLMTFHGSPLHNLALQAGVDFLRAQGVRALAPLNLVLRELVMFDGNPAAEFADALAPIADPGERAEVAAELHLDFHAGFFETSMALHYAPASVSTRHRDLPPCPEIVPDARFVAAARAARLLGRDVLARELEFASVGLGWNQLRPFPGYTGRPALATLTSGAAFARHIVARYEPAALDVLDRGAAPPEPIMAWAGRVSAGGRIGRMSLPPLEA